MDMGVEGYKVCRYALKVRPFVPPMPLLFPHELIVIVDTNSSAENPWSASASQEERFIRR